MPTVIGVRVWIDGMSANRCVNSLSITGFANLRTSASMTGALASEGIEIL
jgi:hypothetical protein